MAGASQSRLSFVVRCSLTCALPAVLFSVIGCASGGSPRTGPVQVQFYGPPGAQIVLRDLRHSAAEIRSRGPLGDRLENEIEDLAVYDLSPGTYRFAYANGPGAEEAAIYGELELRPARTRAGRLFCDHAFLPVRLISADHQEAEQLFPSRDLSYTQGLEAREFDHIKQGDLIEQVYFVADLDKAKHEYEVDYFQAINDVDRALSVIADQEEYLIVRYDSARRRALFRNADVNIEDKVAHDRFDRWGVEESFITLARKRKALERERESLMLVRTELEDQRSRRHALLRSMRIVHRSGALVLATPDLKMPFRDSIEQAADLGEVLAVVRIGGRHQYWAWDELVGAGESEGSDIVASNP